MDTGMETGSSKSILRGLPRLPVTYTQHVGNGDEWWWQIRYTGRNAKLGSADARTPV